LEDNDQSLTGAQKVKVMLKGIMCTHSTVNNLMMDILITHPTDFEGASSVIADDILLRTFPAPHVHGDGRAKRQISAMEHNHSCDHQNDALTKVIFK
jgi:hypothetical protein